MNAKNNVGDTPLDLATHPSNPNASPEIADLLRKHGAKTKVEFEPAGTTKGFDENRLPVSVAPATRAQRN